MEPVITEVNEESESNCPPTEQLAPSAHQSASLREKLVLENTEVTSAPKSHDGTPKDAIHGTQPAEATASPPSRPSSPPDASASSSPVELRGASDCLDQPQESRMGGRVDSILRNVIFVVIGINICVMSAQTLDGPRFSGSSPAYHYLPDDRAFVAAEFGFTMVYLAEFLLRLVTSKSRRRFWRRMQTWIAVLALSPLLIVKANEVMYAMDDTSFNAIAAEDKINMLRIVRIVRLVLFLGPFDGTQVMYKALVQAMGPLTITLFFLITVVMVFATAIYYAEPCYDLDTCAFRDIFNTAYFVMVTVATVGYGSQVPSMTNVISLALTCLVMVFGSWYISMPLASVGINYDLAWIDYESKLQRTPTGIDQTLQPLEIRWVFKGCDRIGDNYYELTEKMHEISIAIQQLLVGDKDRRGSELARAKSRSDATTKLLESILTARKSHRKICTDIRDYLPLELLKKKNTTPMSRGRAFGSFLLQSPNAATSSAAATAFLSLAKQVLTNKTAASLDMKKIEERTVRMEIWRVLNHMGASKRMVVINRIRLVVVLASVAMFFLQTMPEMQHTGVNSMLCQRTVRSFCAKTDAPGCHVYTANGTITTQSVQFNCAATSDDPTCYAKGYNYGSPGFNRTCLDVFGTAKQGAAQVCKSRVCSSGTTKEITTTLLDMEPHWVYLEFFFGMCFTMELLLRVYAHPVRKELWKEFRVLLDAIVLFPFYVEVAYLLLFAELPIYSIVPTPPSFFSLVRVFKSFRIIKLAEHIAGSTVLVRTAQQVYKRLLIPLFFLFIGCLIIGAIMFETERGIPCFVGAECMYWHKNIMTRAIAQDLPVGKRIQVQDTHRTTITDMLRSTWFSLVTFTTVGYGDLVPRTSLGRLLDVFGMIFSACYTSMPLTLVGGQFYMCYTSYLHDKRRQRGSLASTQVAPMPSHPSTSPVLLRQAPHHEASHRPSLQFVDMRMVNQFVLIHKVIDVIIEDLGKLCKMGLTRGLVRTKETERNALAQEEELALEKRILDNLDFCNNVLLMFSPIMEQLMGLDPNKRRSLMTTMLKAKTAWIARTKYQPTVRASMAQAMESPDS